MPTLIAITPAQAFYTAKQSVSPSLAKSSSPHPRLPARRGLGAVACGLGAGADSAEAGSSCRRGEGVGDPPLHAGQMSLPLWKIGALR
jgi:hypothetical protein